MRKAALGLFTIVIALSLTACFQHTYVIGDGAPGGESANRWAASVVTCSKTTAVPW